RRWRRPFSMARATGSVLLGHHQHVRRAGPDDSGPIPRADTTEKAETLLLPVLSASRSTRLVRCSL
ncbi:MAG: hypothetical protein M3328_04540, partial [Chloroflexota bacterium]|nr:hypothetical protein [Chloroflexota bacterium]